MRYFMIPVAALAGLVAVGHNGFAQTKSVKEGHRLAQPCARCHVIVANGPPSWTDAPSFESIANRPGVKRAWLVDFVQKQHVHMLTDIYTPAQADSIASYILSLRRK